MIPVKEGKSAGIDAINMTRSISVTALILRFFYFVPGQSERVQRAAGATHGMKRTTAEIMNCKKKKKKKKDCVTFRCLCSFTFLYSEVGIFYVMNVSIHCLPFLDIFSVSFAKKIKPLSGLKSDM